MPFECLPRLLHAKASRSIPRRRGLLLSPCYLHWLGKIIRTDTNEREINLDQFMLQTLCIYDSIGLSGYLSGAITDSSASGMNHGIR